jgi:outer membrane protein assembly factor BamB
VRHTDDLAVVEWIDDTEGVVTLTGIDLESGDEVWESDPIPYGLEYRLTVSEESEQAYIAANFGASSAIHALDLEDGALAWDAAYHDLSEATILRVTDETVYLSASTEDETFLIAVETD